ncbi:hypothetical protein M404DRAFT_35961 [Pisolithus tinctorius Marx 270]|uniref:Uncharacterized protein n=1 Tax=Pisolithus tinctorius Marx 270 TaxID=870435 RepID=A0A0C3I8Y3_PISTI|nr:hypothetical protein M404DRAFT_35961 [Pisolithus tinctorius Marx 270]
MSTTPLVCDSTSVTQASKTAKAGPSKRTIDDDNEVEVVKSHTRMKGKAPVHSRLDAKVTADLLQLLRLLRAEAVELQATYLRLQDSAAAAGYDVWGTARLVFFMRLSTSLNSKSS